MKICLLVTGLQVGGAERQVVDLADIFVRRGHSVLLIVLTGDEKISPQSAEVKTICLKANKSPFSLLVAYLRARAIIRDFSPDVVHSHMVHANIFARLLRLCTPMKRLISTAHNVNEGGILRIFAYRITDWIPDISTNVSEEAVEAFIRKGATKKGRMIAVYNGVDTEKFAFSDEARTRIRSQFQIPDNAIMLLAAGRLHEQKDYPNLLAAFSRVLQKRTDCFLYIAGEGPLEGKLKRLSIDLGVASNVSFLGVRNDIPDLMSAADIFVLASTYEGFSLVMAEAMSCEMPVVATDCGGVAEVVGDCGYLVPVGNAPALAQKIEEAIALDEGAKRTLGKKARERIVTKYSLESAATRWEALYRGESGSEC